MQAFLIMQQLHALIAALPAAIAPSCTISNYLMASKRSICWRTYCLLNHVQYPVVIVISLPVGQSAIANHSSLIPLISG